jgi:hypothetical protein
MTHELDGIYQVSSTTSYNGPLAKKSDGVTEIKNSQTERRDNANCLWTSTFTIINENEVEMISVADPSEADGDFSLTRPDGTPTREPVTYKAILKLARKGDKIQLSGEVEYDNDVTLLTMRKIS